MEKKADIAIVGAGIAGLAHAYMALRKGYKVVLFERDQFAVGASVRNFGLSWPIGQEPAVGLEYALRARHHWQEVAQEAGFWMKPNGSLHVVYNDDEWDVLQEFMQLYRDAPYDCTLLSPEQVKERSGVVIQKGLRGGLWSSTESTVNPREAIRKIPLWLRDTYGLVLRYGNVVKEIALPHIHTARETWEVSKVFVCSGADFETLYPEVFDNHPVSKCKLQMMKAVPAKPLDLGPTLCAGLTLRHYAAFGKCPSLPKVDARYDAESEAYKDNGVHVLLAQNQAGELIIGDSHHYSRTVEPFDDEEINDLILDYLKSFADLGAIRITERWHGVYPKLMGDIHLIVRPQPNVTVVTGLGGAGMTLSFGIAEKLIDAL